VQETLKTEMTIVYHFALQLKQLDKKAMFGCFCTKAKKIKCQLHDLLGKVMPEQEPNY